MLKTVITSVEIYHFQFNIKDLLKHSLGREGLQKADVFNIFASRQ